MHIDRMKFFPRLTVTVLALALGPGLFAAPAAAPKQPPVPVVKNPPPTGPLRVCLVSGSDEYKSEASLGEFKKYFETTYHATCTLIVGKDKGKELPGIQALATNDVLVLFARRVTLPDDQLEIVKAYLDAGKPLVGIRTASHALQNLPELDKEILGGSYGGHYSDELAKITIDDPKARRHPILAGVKPFTTMGKLYKNPTLAPDVHVLLNGATPSHKEPVAWLRQHKGGRVFYTSLGVPEDFKDENFRQMLANALFWTARREPMKK